MSIVLALLALCGVSRAGVLINEVLYDPSGSDAGFEWVELCNDGTSSVDLTGYTIESAGSSWSESYTLGAGSIAPGEHLIVGFGGTTWSGSFDPALQNGGSDTDGLRLKNGTATVVDTLLYDSPNTNALVDDGGTAGTSFAVDATEGTSLGRYPDCGDSGASGVDFVQYAAPSPAAENEAPVVDTGGDDTAVDDTGDTGGTADCTGTRGVTINEFSPATDVEWVELYNSGPNVLDIGGWTLNFGTSTFNKEATFPDGTLLPASGWIVLGSTGAAVRDVEIDIDLGNATSSADAMQVQCNGAAVDTVIYGDSSTNDDGWLDDDGLATVSFAPVPGDGESTARVADGYDTNQSGSDFAVTETTTPGAANPHIEPTVCDPTGSESLKINEFLYDPGSTDGGNEWVELFNAGTADVRVDGFTIETATSSWGTDFTFPGGITIAAGAYVLIGGESVAGSDFIATDLSIGNGGDGDGLRLVDCTAAVVDTVLYGETMADGLTGDDGSDAVVEGVDSDVSLGRAVNGVDTDTPDDWMGFDSPTPGEPNDVSVGGDDTGTGKPGGCGGDRPDSERPGACSVAPPLGGLEGLLVALVLVRRKRQS
jgi:hypothetical protein